MRSFTLVAVLALLASLGVATVPAHAQSAENVAVVINDASAQSQQIAEHYIRTRQIPASNVIHIATSTDDTIERAAYVSEIETPIGLAIRAGGLHDRILYIVLTKGVPLRIAGTRGQNGTVSSVDSELTLLYRRMTGRDVPTRGRVVNPFYLGGASLTVAQPFTHRDHDIYLVTRLDAFTVEEAIALIERGQSPVQDGRFVLDQRGGVFGDPIGDRWLSEASQRLADLGWSDRAVLESTTNPARHEDKVIGYYSWGSNDPENRVRRTEMRFVPGALAAMFVSGDARTFTEPPPAWRPTNDWNNRTTWFNGSPQSLAGDLIREGVTGVAGHVAEPYLQSAIRPEVLFPAYVAGSNLAEAFYMAIPDLSWQSVVVGDPLCAAFPRKLLTRADTEAGIDPDTELPAHFSARRREVLRSQVKGATPGALNLLLRAEARRDRRDQAGVREALERATAESPDLAVAQLLLASAYEEAGEYARAHERYAQVLRLQPNNTIALNNLAYGLAVHEQNLADALPLARRAVRLAPKQPTIVDTLAWIEHLAGNSAEAARLLRNVVRQDTGIADVHLHAASVFAAVGDLREAAAQLKKAVELKPSLDQTDQVRALRVRLQRQSP